MTDSEVEPLVLDVVRRYTQNESAAADSDFKKDLRLSDAGPTATGRSASAAALKEGIQLHIEQTQTQIERVEQAMEKLAIRPGRKVCEAMRGLVEEAQNSIGEQE